MQHWAGFSFYHFLGKGRYFFLTKSTVYVAYLSFPIGRRVGGVCFFFFRARPDYCILVQNVCIAVFFCTENRVLSFCFCGKKNTA